MAGKHTMRNTWLSSLYIKFLEEVHPISYGLTQEDDELVRSFLFYVVKDCFFAIVDSSIHLG